MATDRLGRRESRQPVRGDFPLLPLQPVKVMGLDPLYGGDPHSLTPAPVRGSDFSSYQGGGGPTQDQPILVRWNDHNIISWSSIVQNGIILGGLWGFGVGTSRCLANWTMAILGIPFYPLAKLDQSMVLFPSPKQYAEYAKFKFNEKFGLHALWNKLTRKTLNPILPMPKAVAQRLAEERELKANQWLKLNLFHAVALEHEPQTYPKFPTKPKLWNFDPLWYMPRRVAHTWVTLKKWYNTHPLKVEAEYYRIQNYLLPTQGIPVGTRLEMFFRHYLKKAYGPAHTIYHLYTWRYATQHVREGYKRGPFTFCLLSMCFWLIPKPFKALGVDDSVALCMTVLGSYHIYSWFWGRRPLKPTLPPRKHWLAYFFLTAISLEGADILIRFMDAGGIKVLQKPGENPELKKLLKPYIDPEPDLLEIPMLVHFNNAVEIWGRIREEQKVAAAKKAIEYEKWLGKDNLFPGEGWDPDHMTITDAGEERKIKVFSKEWRNWEMFSPTYGSLKAYEQFEKEAEELFGFSGKKETTDKSIIEEMGGKVAKGPIPLGQQREKTE